MGLKKMVQPLWTSVWLSLRKLDVTLPEDPAIPLLGIDPEDSPACNKGTCSTMFIAALFIIARSWEKTQMSLNVGMDTENVVYLYRVILLSN